MGIMTGTRMLFDTLYNLMSGLGTSKDKTTGATYTLTQLTKLDLENAYRGDWITRKVIDAPSEDATRQWRQWEADEEQIEALEETEKKFQILSKVQWADKLARLYGGSAIILGVKGSRAEQELDLERVTKDSLQFVHVVSRWEFSVSEPNRDLLSPWFGRPLYYERQVPGSLPVRIHPSRIIPFIGKPTPDPEQQPAIEGWGDPILQSVDDAVKGAGIVNGGIATLVQEAKVDIIRMPELSEKLSTQEYADRLTARFTYANTIKSITNALLLDKEEEWERLNATWAGLPDIMKMYLLIAAGAADIPVTRLLGQAPAGLNATGESDTRNYYDRIGSDQITRLTPALAPLDEILIRHTFGSRDPAIHYNWNPLWQMTPNEEADLNKKEAEIFQMDLNSGLFSPEVLRKVRQNQLIERGVYPGLEAAVEEEGEEPDIPAAESREIEAENAEATRQALIAKSRPIVRDAEPRTLYVRRDVINTEDIIAWAERIGLKPVPAKELHVTIMYSRTPVDWMKVGSADFGQDERGRVRIPPGGVRIVEGLGNQGAIVLMFTSSTLMWRHEDIKQRAGASWDYESYQPHITVAYVEPGSMAVYVDDPYRGEIILGPEIFEETKTAFDPATLGDKFDPNQPRVPKGASGGGQWTEGSGNARVYEPVPFKNMAKMSPKEREQYIRQVEGPSWTKGHGKFSNRDLDAIDDFTSMSEGFNRKLRTGKKLDADERKTAAGIDRLLRKSLVDRDSIVYRGVSGSKVNAASFNKSLGKVITLPGYTSTTKDPKVADNFGKSATMEIFLPKGTRALDVTKQNLGEKEIILPHNTRFRVEEVSGRRVRLRVVS